MEPDQIRKFAERVQPIYALLDWQWSNDNVKGIPCVEDIIDVVTSHIEWVKSNADKYANILSGGLYARYQGSGIEFGMEIGDFIDKGYVS